MVSSDCFTYVDQEVNMPSESHPTPSVPFLFAFPLAYAPDVVENKLSFNW